MAGGLFAMQRKYFFDMGTYDLGQEVWGGENLEMSFRIWTCGGSLEIIPCSRVGHVFRSRAPYEYKKDPGLTIQQNLNRVAEVWLDQYADVFYEVSGSRNVPAGNVTSRIELRKRLQCKPFEWYLENVYPDLFVPRQENYHFAGNIRNPAQNVCVDTMTSEINDMNFPGLSECEPAYNQRFYLTKKPRDNLRHEATFGSRCIIPDDEKAGSAVRLTPCFAKKESLGWVMQPTGQLKHIKSGLCLEARPRVVSAQENAAHALVVNTCRRSDPRQKWDMSYVFGLPVDED
eukprot:m.79982 g.79982  ORF g.79982 m.79982 type:complete len:288 (-) comp14811_c0_seq1:267-1130(-)